MRPRGHEATRPKLILAEMSTIIYDGDLRPNPLVNQTPKPDTQTEQVTRKEKQCFIHSFIHSFIFLRMSKLSMKCLNN